MVYFNFHLPKNINQKDYILLTRRTKYISLTYVWVCLETVRLKWKDCGILLHLSLEYFLKFKEALANRLICLFQW